MGRSCVSFGPVGRWIRRSYQTILIASHKWEAALLFDILRNGVLEYWSHGLRERLGGAGPEAGVPTEAGWKMDCARGVIGWLAANMVVLNYTHLHVFTRFYTRFLAINVTSADGGQRIARPTVEGGREEPRKWEKVGRKWESGPAFPTSRP